jgi:MSHA pilin protein MshA
MLKRNGFTLIELVIVIVIVAILGAIAVPKFVSLSRDARIAALEGVEAAVMSTSLLVEIKAKMESVEDGTIELNSDDVAVTNGYIAGHWNNAWRYALDLGKEIRFTNVNDPCSINDYCGVGNQRTVEGVPTDLNPGNVRGLVLIWAEGYSLSDLCYVYYFNSGSEKPTIGTVDEGC